MASRRRTALHPRNLRRSRHASLVRSIPDNFRVFHQVCILASLRRILRGSLRTNQAICLPGSLQGSQAINVSAERSTDCTPVRNLLGNPAASRRCSPVANLLGSPADSRLVNLRGSQPANRLAVPQVSHQRSRLDSLLDSHLFSQAVNRRDNLPRNRQKDRQFNLQASLKHCSTQRPAHRQPFRATYNATD